MIPIKGKKYHYFDNGRISPYRHYTVKITNVIPFGDADKDMLNKWIEEDLIEKE